MDAELKSKIMELLDSPALDNYLKREHEKKIAEVCAKTEREVGSRLLRLEHERDALESNLAKANADLSVWKETAEKYMALFRKHNVGEMDEDKLFAITYTYHDWDEQFKVGIMRKSAPTIGQAILLACENLNEMFEKNH